MKKYTLLYIPHAVFWIFYLKPILQWFAPDLGQDVIEEGYNYFLVSLVGTYISAYSSVLHSLLEVADHYRYGMMSDIAQEIVGVISFVAYLKIFPKQQKSIVWVEIIDTICLFLFLVADLMVAKKMKWFDGFWKGKISLVDMICAFLQDTELNSNPLLCNFFGLKYLLLRQRYYSVCGNEELGFDCTGYVW